MLHHYLLSAIAFLFIFATPIQAQPYDVGVSDVHVSADSVSIPAGITSGMAITITNFDSLAIEAGDTLDVAIEIDGEWYTDQLVLDTPLGGLASRYMAFGSSAHHTFADTLHPVVVRGTVYHALDSNAANDTLDVAYIVQPNLNDDWSALSVEVLSPSNLDSFDIDNGTNIPPAIDQVRVEFQNQGDVTYLQWSVITYDLTLANDTTRVEATLSQGDIAPSETTVRLITNASLFPPVPDTAGTYGLCAVLAIGSDTIKSNNEACYVFTLVDNFDPSDPANWPHGLEDVDGIPFSVHATQSGIEFKGLEQAIDVKVFNMQGAQINEAHMRSAGTLNMTTLAPGIYVVHMTSAQGQVWATKVLMP